MGRRDKSKRSISRGVSWWGKVPKDGASPGETTTTATVTAAEVVSAEPGNATPTSASTTLSAEDAAALQAALDQDDASAAGDAPEAKVLEVPEAFRSPAAVPAEEQAAAHKLLQRQEEASEEILDQISFRVELFATTMEGDQDKACFGMLDYLNRLQNMPAGSPPVPEVIAKALEMGKVRLSWYFVDGDGAPIRELDSDVSQALGYELEEFVGDVREELTKAAQAATQPAAEAAPSATLTMSPADLRTFLDIMVPEERETYIREFVRSNQQSLSLEKMRPILDALSLEQRRMFIAELGRASTITP